MYPINLLYNLQVRKCYNVEELLCGLVETVKYEIVQAKHTIQKCYPVKERVCDTVYESQLNQVDDYQVCINPFSSGLKIPTMYYQLVVQPFRLSVFIRTVCNITDTW